MHFQFYSITNDVYYHIGNIVSGFIYIFLVFIFLKIINYILFLAYCIGYLICYTWLGPYYSLTRFKINFFEFEIKSSVIPLLFIILYLYILI